jgi:predicted RNA-binding protein associated with RNAse of E/G family
MSSLIEFEYHRPGKGTTVYHEWLVLTHPEAKVLLLEHYAGEEVLTHGNTILGRGAPIVWFIFPGAWYDIGRFHLLDGTFTGWYTNLSTPVHFGKRRWIGHDLFLDLWQPVDGTPVWLDEDEFEAAVDTGIIDTLTSRRVMKERMQIQSLLDQGLWPPPIARAIDLPQVQPLRRPSPEGADSEPR